MTISTFKRYEKLGKIFVDYKMQRVKTRVLPVRLWLEPTNKCNLRCRLCPQSTDFKTVRGFMDKALYNKIIDEVGDFVYDINLSHRGESLFHENIIEFIEYAHKAGIKTRIHTNGTILTPEFSREIIKSGLDFFSFSFDGFTKESYENIRIGAKFDETLKNVIQFLEEKKKLGSKMPFTVIQLIQTHSLPEDEFLQQKKIFLNNFKDLPLDKLYIKDPHNWGGIIEEKNAAELAKDQSYSPCTFCWYSLTILWDGTIVPCPQDFFAKIKLGSAKDETIREVWQGKKMQALRNRFISKNVIGLQPCEKCDRLYRKRFMGIPSINMKEFLSENVIGYDALHNLYLRQWKKTGK